MEKYFGPISPVLLLMMIAGLVQMGKKLGLQGTGNMFLSMGLGVGFGVLFQVMEMAPGVFTTWARVGIYGIVFGLAASGLYDVGKKMAAAVGAAAAGAIALTKK